MTKELLELLDTMQAHAEAERQAVRALDARALFELAREGETHAQRLGQLLVKVTPELVGAHAWGAICARAAEVRALAKANHELMRRSLDVIRSVRAPVADDAPAFISRVA